MTTLAMIGLAAIVAAVLLVETWLVVHLRRQGVALERRTGALERRLRARTRGDAWRRDSDATLPAGLPPESILNDFELPDLRGGNVTFSRWRGTRIAVIFVQPNCPHSHILIDAVKRQPPDELVPIFVSTGDEATNRALFEGLPPDVPLLVQADVELARVWRVMAIPSAYVVDAKGVTEGRLRQGAGEILAAIGLPVPEGVDAMQTTSLASIFMSGSEAPRAGDPIPDLESTLLSGESARLLDDHGTLVMSFDPGCRPCRELQPALVQRLDALGRDVGILILSRGDLAGARALAAELGPSVRVAHQASGRLLRQLGIVQTPAALFIDGTGKVLREPAAGADAILGLLDAIPTTAVRS